MNYTINPIIKSDDTAWDLDDISAERYYNKHFNTRLKLVRHSSMSSGMCFNYATKNYNLEYCEDCLSYIKERYIQIDISEIKRGDIVIIYDNFNLYDNEPHEGTVNHFAVIIQASDDISNIIIRSKWGECGIFEGRLIDLPADYGGRVCFYRKKALQKTY